MRDPLFVGAAVALVTPFDARGVAEGVLRDLVRFHLHERTDALVVCGSTGEAVAMTPAEQRRAVEVVVEQVSGRVPVVAGVGGSDTQGVCELARGARAAGADALLVSAPPYNKPPARGVVRHYRAVLDAADLPAIVYNVPGRTACNLLPATLAEIAEDERVVGVKEASGDLSQVADVFQRLGGRVAIYSGNDDQVLPVLSLGGQGVVSVLANVVPADASRMVHAFLSGELAEAQRLQLGLLPLIRALFRESNPVPVKTAVRAMGYDVGEVRLPLVEPTEETRAELFRQMGRVGVPVREGV